MTPDDAARLLQECLEAEDHQYFVVKQRGEYVTIKTGFIQAVRALLAGYKAQKQAINDIAFEQKRIAEQCKKAKSERLKGPRIAVISSFNWRIGVFLQRLERGPEPGKEKGE
jgi:hypothetical protein